MIPYILLYISLTKNNYDYFKLGTHIRCCKNLSLNVCVEIQTTDFGLVFLKGLLNFEC